LEDGAAWLSSGTWSILGFELPEPIISADSLAANFTNEGGWGHTYRFSKNVAGLWLLQQCREAWGSADSYDNLVSEASVAASVGRTFDPDDPDFFAPGDMPRRIEAKLGVDRLTKAQLVRAILESLASRYAAVLVDAERLSGKRASQLHVVGGGSQNRLLNQLTADACGIPVVAGPVEATALGNLVGQLLATGGLGSVPEARQLIRHSHLAETFNPCL
jgi:rhamnulokinase